MSTPAKRKKAAGGSMRPRSAKAAPVRRRRAVDPAEMPVWRRKAAAKVCRAVAAAAGIEVLSMFQAKMPTRDQPLAHARYAAWWVLRAMDWKLVEIAGEFRICDSGVALGIKHATRLRAEGSPRMEAMIEQGKQAYMRAMERIG
jgi:hypothetical protein